MNQVMQLWTGIVGAYRGSDESDALSFNTNSYVHSSDFTVYDMDTPTLSGSSGIGFAWSTGVATVYSMKDSVANGPFIDFYYDNDGTFTSADFRTASCWVNQSGFLLSTSTYDNLTTVATTGYSNATTPVANGQIWQVYLPKNSSSDWHYAKFRIDAVTMSPYVHAQVTFAFQTIKNFARVD